MIYFLCHPGNNRFKITVIDLDESARHERDEFCNVNAETYSSPKEAIAMGRHLAEINHTEYVPFKSRYDSDTSEVCKTPNSLFLIDIHPSKVRAEVRLPMALELSSVEAALLEQEIHDAMESVLAKFF